MSLGRRSWGQNVCGLLLDDDVASGIVTFEGVRLSGLEESPRGLSAGLQIEAGSAVSGSMLDSGGDTATDGESIEYVDCAIDIVRSPIPALEALKNLFHNDPFRIGPVASEESDCRRSDETLPWDAPVAVHVL